MVQIQMIKLIKLLNLIEIFSRKINSKVNFIIILIRNLNTTLNLHNETQVRLKCLHCGIIDCRLLKGIAEIKLISFEE